jgi:AraC-like DNA-binding protein
MFKNVNDMGFWIFSWNNPELYRFYSEQIHNDSLYYILYIKKCGQDVSSETKEVLHLREESILLVDSYLVPIFYRLRLDGYVVIISEEFCASDENRALLKLVFFHNQPEGIIDMGDINKYQKKCIDLLYKEYSSPYDDLQASMIKNLLVNIALFSSIVNYEGQLKSGHLLKYALQFMDLVDNYALVEKKKSFYADRIGITEKMLSKALQFIYHKSYKEILTNRIIIEAMRLLVFSDENITRIADELGYNISDFIKFFSKRKGMHPKELRINYRKILNEIENGCPLTYV